MSNSSAATEIERHVPQDVLESILLNSYSPGSNAEMKVYQRLRFILLRYEGRSVSEASNIVGVNRQTGYNWQDLWNRGGLDAIVPGKSTGRPSCLTFEQLTSFADAVVAESATTQRAADILEDMFGIRYTSKHIIELLRDQGLRLVKLYELDGAACDLSSERRPYALRWVR